MEKLVRTFAQVLLVIFFTIVISVVIEFLSPDGGVSFVLEVLSTIPIFDTWLSLLENFYTFNAEIIPTIFIRSFFEAITMGICMTVCGKIGKIFPFAKILITFIGLIIGLLLTDAIGNQDGISVIAVGLITLYGLALIFRSVFRFFKFITLNDFLIIIINSFVAVILTGYIATLSLFASGNISFHVLLCMAIISAISLLILYSVDGIEELKKKI